MNQWAIYCLLRKNIYYFCGHAIFLYQFAVHYQDEKSSIVVRRRFGVVTSATVSAQNDEMDDVDISEAADDTEPSSVLLVGSIAC